MFVLLFSGNKGRLTFESKKLQKRISHEELNREPKRYKFRFSLKTLLFSDNFHKILFSLNRDDILPLQTERTFAESPISGLN